MNAGVHFAASVRQTLEQVAVERICTGLYDLRVGKTQLHNSHRYQSHLPECLTRSRVREKKTQDYSHLTKQILNRFGDLSLNPRRSLCL